MPVLKLFVVAAMAVAVATTGAAAQSRKSATHAAPPPPPQSDTDKTLPTPDDIARWMNETVGHILEPVDTIVNPKAP